MHDTFREVPGGNNRAGFRNRVWRGVHILTRFHPIVAACLFCLPAAQKIQLIFDLSSIR
jgi:hypothetical protein